MPISKQLFVFNVPAKNLLTEISKYPVHFFANAINGVALIANDLLAEHVGATSISDLLGRNIFELIPKAEAEIVMTNNITAMNSNIPQLIYETGMGTEYLCIKTQLLNSSNHIIGTGGIAFNFHQIPLKDIITLTNKLVCLSPVMSILKYDYISNTRRFNKLSYREKECVHFLAKGMTYKEIANALNIGARTVETHIGHIKNKLGCYKRSDIISKVFELEK